MNISVFDNFNRSKKCWSRVLLAFNENIWFIKHLNLQFKISISHRSLLASILKIGNKSLFFQQVMIMNLIDKSNKPMSLLNIIFANLLTIQRIIGQNSFLAFGLLAIAFTYLLLNSLNIWLKSSASIQTWWITTKKLHYKTQYQADCGQ